MAKGPVLSKSKFLSGLQCRKFLWYQYHKKQDIPPHRPVTKLAFEDGKKVGALAQTLFPGGIKITWDYDPQKVMMSTIAALLKKKPVFEAGFVSDAAYALADILLPVEGGVFDLIEVKSSFEVKSEHYYDAAFQKYAAEGAGINIRKCFLMFIDREFVKQGPVDPAKFFKKEEITGRVEELMPEIRAEIKTLLELISSKDMPDIKIGPQCKNPYECPLIDVCWDYLPEDHILILHRGGKTAFELLERGVLKVADIPPEVELEPKQIIQVECHHGGQAHIEKDQIRGFLAGIKYPIYFLDFETMAPPIPIYDRTRPKQDVPFQFSLHIVEKEGAPPIHHEFLADGAADPRPDVLKKLKEMLGNSGSIIAYYAEFEQRCLKLMAEAYPEYQEWYQTLEPRFVDLLVPFKNFFYYHPAQQGRAGMKNVLPAITGISYDNLKIREGGEAQAEYMRVTYGQDVKEEDRKSVREALLRYCELDTLGMVRILEALKEASQ